MILRCASCACAIRLLVHRRPVRVLILHELSYREQMFNYSRSCKHDCCGKLEVRINDAIINWSTIRSIQRHADQQTKTVTETKTDWDGHTVRDTHSDVTEICRQTDTNMGAHSLIDSHWSTNTKTHTHTPPQPHTDRKSVWNRHPQYHRFLLFLFFFRTHNRGGPSPQGGLIQENGYK